MKKILIFSQGEKLGDGIIKIPFIYDLKKNLSSSVIYWVANGTTAYKSTLNSFIKDKIDFIYEDLNIGIHTIYRSNKLFKKLSMNEYDLIIDTQKTFIKTFFLKKLKTKIFLSNCADGIFSNIKNYKKLDNHKKRYYLDNIYNLLELYLDKRIVKRSQIEYPKNILETISKLFEPKKKYFGIAPGAGEKEKIWPIEKFIEIIKKFKMIGYTPCFFLGTEDKWARKELQMHFGEIFEPEKYYNNISNVLIIMASTKFLTFAISNDSGVSHILSTGDCCLFKLFNDKIPTKFTKNNNNIYFIEPDHDNNIKKISIDKVYKIITEVI